MIRALRGAVIALVLAACTGSASAPASLPAHDVLVTTDSGGALRFEPVAPAVAGTRFHLLFRNVSTMPHNLTFEGLEARTQTIVNPGAFEVIPVSVPGPGQYPFVCTIHPTMKGALTVS
jgi:plastocyanin